MVKVTQVRYARKVNLGNFQNEDIEMVGQVAEDEDPIVAALGVKALALAAAGLRDEAETALADARELAGVHRTYTDRNERMIDDLSASIAHVKEQCR